MDPSESSWSEQPEVVAFPLDRESSQVEAAREAERQAYEHYGLTFTEHFITVPSLNTRMRVAEVGSGLPVVILPGGVGKGCDWLPLLPELEGYRLFVVDRPGGGFSDGIDYRTRPLRELAITVTAAVFDQFAIDSAPIIGHSMGAFYGLQFALDQPERVSALAFLGCPGFYPGFRVPVAMRLMALPGIGRLVVDQLAQPGNPDDVWEILEFSGHPSRTLDRISDEYYEASWRVESLSHSKRSWLTLAQTVVSLVRPRGFHPDLEFTASELGNTPVPVILIWGSDDPFGSSDTGKHGANYFPRAQFHQVGTGHFPWLDAPETCGALIQEFFSDTTED